MNTYEIFFTRENGTTGSDRFTAPDEKQARKDFRECSRHSTGTITEVKLVSENVPASKEQERKALESIRAIVATLGRTATSQQPLKDAFKTRRTTSSMTQLLVCMLVGRIPRKRFPSSRVSLRPVKRNAPTPAPPPPNSTTT